MWRQVHFFNTPSSLHIIFQWLVELALEIHTKHLRQCLLGGSPCSVPHPWFSLLEGVSRCSPVPLALEGALFSPGKPWDPSAPPPQPARSLDGFLQLPVLFPGRQLPSRAGGPSAQGGQRTRQLPFSPHTPLEWFFTEGLWVRVYVSLSVLFRLLYFFSRISSHFLVC